MPTLLLVFGCALAFILAYHTYGRWLARRVFGLAADPAAVTPAHALRDGRDFVPTRRSVVFGHHFTSIAATGPIVGPAIAVMWGWLPALLWVVLGSVFMGAVHDLGALAVSLRARGRSIGDVAGDLLGPRVRLLFLGLLLLALTIIIAIFGLVIAAVFRAYPATITPVLIQIPIAAVIGVWLHRRGASLTLPSVVALALMYAGVLFGDVGPLGAFNAWCASWPTIVWVAVLLGYCYVASVLPVWALLQPRDYINALQLITALGLVVAGLIAAGVWGGAPASPEAARPALGLAAAPALRVDAPGAPPMLPFLFITIACGAVSGFHCLVASGTSSKQLDREADAQFVGYGSMLIEAFLAVIVIVACTAGLGLGITGTGTGTGGTLLGAEAWAARYASWGTAGGLAAKVGAFVDGSANFLHALGLPATVAVALMGVFVASFAATTLDSATRLQRYVIQELGGGRAGARRINRHAATGAAVLSAGALAALPAPGQPLGWLTAGGGGLILWPMFGAVNQLMAGLALGTVAVWLRARGHRTAVVCTAAAPAALMLALPTWALLHQALAANADGTPGWLHADAPNWPLIAIAALTLAGVAWITLEGLLHIRRG